MRALNDYEMMLIFDYGKLLTKELEKRLAMKFPEPTHSDTMIYLETLCHMNGIDTVKIYEKWRKSVKAVFCRTKN